MLNSSTPDEYAARVREIREHPKGKCDRCGFTDAHGPMCTYVRCLWGKPSDKPCCTAWPHACRLCELPIPHYFGLWPFCSLGCLAASGLCYGCHGRPRDDGFKTCAECRKHPPQGFVWREEKIK